MNVKVFNLISRTNEIRDIQWHETCKCKCRLQMHCYRLLIQVFVIINKDGMKINADVNVKNWSTKEYVMKSLIGILAVANVNVINIVMLENI